MDQMADYKSCAIPGAGVGGLGLTALARGFTARAFLDDPHPQRELQPLTLKSYLLKKC